MKKSILLLAATGLFLGACSTDQGNDMNGNEENTSRNFLSVSLVASNISTRAQYDASYPGNPGNYLDGEAYENNVNTIRFFFFNSDGSAAPVYKLGSTDNYLSYIDWTPASGDYSGPEHGETVEKVINATLGISKPSDASLPTMVLAILNPETSVTSLQGNPNLSTLRQVISDYYTNLHYNNFVITNSVYVDNDGNTVDATPIASTCYGSTEAQAAENPLIIYVERVLARLDFSVSAPYVTLPDGSTVYATSNTDYSLNDENNQTQNQNIYVKFYGWNVTTTTSDSRLVKNINPSWPIDNLFGELNQPWSVAGYHRSYWAINPQANMFTYHYGNFNGTPDPSSENYQVATANQFPASGAYSTVYMQENAAAYETSDTGAGPTNPTQVIMAGQLVNGQGQPVSMARWANRYYTMEGVMNALANSLDLYQVTTHNGTTSYTKIQPSQLQFVTAHEIYGDKLPNNVSAYYVYAQLNNEAANLTWQEGNAAGTPPLSVTEANQYIINRTNYVMAWEKGLTYYFFDIRHLGAEGYPGYYGVVRNHIYAANLKGIAGLGTPVYKPDEIIIPEKPEDDNAVLSAEVKILSWRIVSQDYSVSW